MPHPTLALIYLNPIYVLPSDKASQMEAGSSTPLAIFFFCKTLGEAMNNRFFQEKD